MAILSCETHSLSEHNMLKERAQRCRGHATSTKCMSGSEGLHQQGGNLLAAASPLPDQQRSNRSKDSCQASNHPACCPVPASQQGRVNEVHDQSHVSLSV